MSNLTPAKMAEINEFGEAEAHANYFHFGWELNALARWW
jgi:hypothetical protein